VTERACEALTGLRLPDDTRLVMEKPFGTDANSAAALNRLLARLVPEERVHRVDHFLGTSTVLNIFGVRFANRILEPVMNAEHVESVDVVFDETLGLEGRAGYYDHAGALVDMIQSHLLQVMSLVAMEPPSTIGAADVRDGKAQVLRATRVWEDDPAARSHRARYTAGQIDGRQLPAYIDEDGIPSDSTTETLAEVVLAVDTWRWAGVPFRLRSGKALSNPRQEVTITFKPAPRLPVGLTGPEQPDRLHLGIALGVGRMSIELNVNGPGDPTVIDPITLAAEMGAGELPEYGEVLKTILDGDRLCRYAPTRPSTAGGSSSRSSMPGTPIGCRCRSMRPAAPARRAGRSPAWRRGHRRCPAPSPPPRDLSRQARGPDQVASEIRIGRCRLQPDP
jgi:glucose-6-phosphate 1-dehydrogenase